MFDKEKYLVLKMEDKIHLNKLIKNLESFYQERKNEKYYIWQDISAILLSCEIR